MRGKIKSGPWGSERWVMNLPVVDGRVFPVHVLRSDLNMSISSSRRAIRTENGDESRLRSAQPDRLEMIGRSSVDR